MTGAVQAAAGAAAGNGVWYSVTPANIGGSGNFGYNDSGSPTGAISSTSAKSNTIRSASGGPAVSGSEFGISINGSPSQSFFRAILVQTTAGSWRRFESSAASFTPAASAIWSWNAGGSSPVWTSTTVRDFQIIY